MVRDYGITHIEEKLMATFHINPISGDVGKCSAVKGKCPFGTSDEHFTSAEAARSSYESKMEATVRKSDAQTVPSNEHFNRPSFYDYGKEMRKLGAKIDKLPESDDKQKLIDERLALKEAQNAAGELHAKRLTVASQWPYGGSLAAGLADGSFQKSAPTRKPGRLEEGTYRAVAELSSQSQRDLYSLPAEFLPTLISSSTYRHHGASNLRDIVTLAKELHEADPYYRPQRREVPARSTGYLTPEGQSAMQNLAPETNDLLHTYVKRFYPGREIEFWSTVKSDTRNLPKISDFMRSVKNFK